MANYIEARLAQFRADAEKQIQFHANRCLLMTDQQHPITPPRELIEQWASEKCYDERDWLYEIHIANRAAQWGADQELQACCEWLQEGFGEVGDFPQKLRAARRPKPPSLKEQALEALRHAPGPDCPNPITLLTADEHALIRRALEQLDD